MRRTRYAIAAAIGAIGVSVFALKFLPVPFFWIGLIWAIAGFVTAVWLPDSLRFPVVIAGSASLAIAAGEVFFSVSTLPEIVREIQPPLNREDALLGWKPRPSQVSRAKAQIDREIIYDVSYSVDASGHRIPPPDLGEGIKGCLFFFADSFVFGEGVNDQETFPYRVGIKTRGRYRVVNFAVPGYGAEHMLAAIERGELAGQPPCRPTHVFYAALPHHVHRAVGKTPFSIYGPRYRLGPNGNPEYLHTNLRRTDSNSDLGIGPHWRQQLAWQLSKSRIYRAWTNRLPLATDSDVKLYIAVVRKAFQLIERRWPNTEFHLIIWDTAVWRDTYHVSLESIGARTHYVDNILPNYATDSLKYLLHRFDGHPNPLAHDMLASYLIEKVLR